MIARYHRHRIAAAIFEVTLSAQVTITHQRNPFPLPFEAIPQRLRARSPINSVFQIVASFVLLYCPYYVIVLWNSSLASLHNGNIPKSLEVPCLILILSFTLIHLTVFVNIIIYGLKSKVMRKSIQNYWRKKKTKNEINNEIQARTPSTCGSRRPSLNAISFHRSVSSRRLSETYINLNQRNNINRPQMKRIASELSWQPLTLQMNSPTNQIPHSSSANTLQIPMHGNNELIDGHRIEREQFVSLCDSMKAQNHNLCNIRHSKSNLNIATALLNRVFRIDFSDVYKRNEPLSPLKSPQILITSAYSDDSDPNTQSTPFKMQKIPNHQYNNDDTISLYDTEHLTNENKIDNCDESDTTTTFTTDLYKSLSKRCLSLDEPANKYTNNSNTGDFAEPLLLSWPITRKKYKHLKDYEANVNPLFNDRCDEPEIVL